MKRSTMEKAVDFFYPYFMDNVYIIFYGGEPLLEFDTIAHAVSLLEEKNKKERKEITWSLTTNGSLITEEMLRFFDRRRFSIMLSYDGLVRKMGRDPGSSVKARDLIRRIQQYPGIRFSTNSVFTPASITRFFESMRSIIESGITEAGFSLSILEQWELPELRILERELERLSDFLVPLYIETKSIPVKDFRGREIEGNTAGRRFACAAGLDRMAVTPDEKIWGCYLFYDYLKDKEGGSDYRRYFFGGLDQFIDNHPSVYPGILDNYSDLRQDRFVSEDRFCFLCEEVEHCRVCPVHAAYPTGFIGKIPPWICGINKIKEKVKDKFLFRIST